MKNDGFYLNFNLFINIFHTTGKYFFIKLVCNFPSFSLIDLMKNKQTDWIMVWLVDVNIDLK